MLKVFILILFTSIIYLVDILYENCMKMSIIVFVGEGDRGRLIF